MSKVIDFFSAAAQRGKKIVWNEGAQQGLDSIKTAVKSIDHRNRKYRSETFEQACDRLSIQPADVFHIERRLMIENSILAALFWISVVIAALFSADGWSALNASICAGVFYISSLHIGMRLWQVQIRRLADFAEYIKDVGMVRCVFPFFERLVRMVSA